MEPNLNLYITVLTITFSHLTVRGAKLIYILNRTIYTQHTPQVHTLTQAHTGYMFSASAATASCHLLKGAGTRCVCSEELSEPEYAQWLGNSAAHVPGTGKAAGCC